MENTLLLLLPAVIAAATFTIATVALVARRRRHARLSATLTSITELRVPSDTFSRRTLPAGAATGSEPTGEPLQVRSLRAHVRTLEAALEQEQERAVLERQDASTAEEVAAYRRRVDATIRAMSRQMEGDGAAEVILARVAAAVDRLAAPNGFVRPTLSPAGPVAVLTRPADSIQLHSVGVAPETTQLLPHATMPALDESSEAVSWTAEADLEPAPAEPEVVLPVPLMAQSEENRRGRLRFRARAA